MVCVSGGKDSYTCLMFITVPAYRAVNFDVVAPDLDQKQPGFPECSAALWKENNIPCCS